VQHCTWGHALGAPWWLVGAEASGGKWGQLGAEGGNHTPRTAENMCNQYATQPMCPLSDIQVFFCFV
jgi:hypothetical protein